MELNRVPLHRQVAKAIRKQIALSHKPGDKFASQNVLARQFGISPTTVREAVSALVQEGILERRHGSGTFVAEPRGELVVGVLIELDISCPNTSYYWLRLTQQLRRFFEAHGLASRLYCGMTQAGSPPPLLPTSPEFAADLKRGRLAGLAIIGSMILPPWVELLRQNHVPTVGQHRSLFHAVPNVWPRLIRAATERLIELGRRDIAFIGWQGASDKIPPGSSMQYEEFSAVLRRHNLPERPERAAIMTPPSRPTTGWDAMRTIWTARRQRPDAVLVADDMLYAGASMAIESLGLRVPRQLTVATHWTAGSPIAIRTPVVGLVMDVDDHARRIGQSLLDVMAGRAPQRDASYPGFELKDLQPDEQLAGRPLGAMPQ